MKDKRRRERALTVRYKRRPISEGARVCHDVEQRDLLVEPRTQTAPQLRELEERRLAVAPGGSLTGVGWSWSGFEFCGLPIGAG